MKIDDTEARLDRRRLLAGASAAAVLAAHGQPIRAAPGPSKASPDAGSAVDGFPYEITAHARA